MPLHADMYQTLRRVLQDFLKARGSLTVWLDKRMSWFAAASGKRGRSPSVLAFMGSLCSATTPLHIRNNCVQIEFKSSPVVRITCSWLAMRNINEVGEGIF